MAVTWNPADKDAGITLSNGNLTATDSIADGSDRVVRATEGKASTGRWYFEVLVDADAFDFGVGLATTFASLSGHLGFQGQDGISYNRSGNVYYSSSLLGTVASYTVGDVIGVVHDASTRKVNFFKNGAYQMEWTMGGLTSTLRYPAVMPHTQATGRFKNAAFSYTPPFSASAWEAVQGAKIYNGSSWVEKPIKVYNGSSWVQKGIKLWNGSAWE